MTATQTVTRYEVVFGADEADRQTYIDHHDGSYISSSAESRATSAYVQLVKNGIACGFFVDGVLKNGTDPNAETAESDRHEEGAATIGTRVSYTTDEDETERFRVFSGNAIDHNFSVQRWRSVLAGLVFGDFSAYYRIRNVRVIEN